MSLEKFANVLFSSPQAFVTRHLDLGKTCFGFPQKCDRGGMPPIKHDLLNFILLTVAGSTIKPQKH